MHATPTLMASPRPILPYVNSQERPLLSPLSSTELFNGHPSSCFSSSCLCSSSLFSSHCWHQHPSVSPGRLCRSQLFGSGPLRFRHCRFQHSEGASLHCPRHPRVPCSGGFQCRWGFQCSGGSQCHWGFHSPDFHFFHQRCPHWRSCPPPAAGRRVLRRRLTPVLVRRSTLGRCVFVPIIEAQGCRGEIGQGMGRGRHVQACSHVHAAIVFNLPPLHPSLRCVVAPSQPSVEVLHRWLVFPGVDESSRPSSRDEILGSYKQATIALVEGTVCWVRASTLSHEIVLGAVPEMTSSGSVLEGDE